MTMFLISYNYSITFNLLGRKQGCVAMTTGIIAGLWDVLSCFNKEKYICKQTADGLVTTPAPSTHPPLGCSEDWMSMASRDFCVRVKLTF